MADEEVMEPEVEETEIEQEDPESTVLPQTKGVFAPPTPLPEMPLPQDPDANKNFVMRFLDGFAERRAREAGHFETEASKKRLLEHEVALQYNSNIKRYNIMQEEAYKNTMAQASAKKKARGEQADIIENYVKEMDDGPQKDFFKSVAMGLRADLDPSIMKALKPATPKAAGKQTPEELAIAEYQKKNPKATYQEAKSFVETKKSSDASIGSYVGKTEAAMNDPDIIEVVDSAAVNGDLNADAFKGFGSSERNAFVKLMVKRHPEVDQAKLAANIKFLGDPIINRQVNYINGVLPRIESIRDKIKKLHPTPFPSLNAAQNWIRKQGGDEVVVDFFTNTNSTVMEAVRALTGSVVGSELRTRLELSNLDKNYNSKQMSKAIDNQVAALNAMKDARNMIPFPEWNKRGKDKILDDDTAKSIFRIDAGKNAKEATKIAKQRGYTHDSKGRKL